MPASEWPKPRHRCQFDHPSRHRARACPGGSRHHGIIAERHDQERRTSSVQPSSVFRVQAIIMVVTEMPRRSGAARQMRSPALWRVSAQSIRGGLPHSDQTGSVRMYSPAAWIRSVACATIVIRMPSTRRCGIVEVTATCAGHGEAFDVRRHRQRSRSDRSIAGWSG